VINRGSLGGAIPFHAFESVNDGELWMKPGSQVIQIVVDAPESASMCNRFITLCAFLVICSPCKSCIFYGPG
jgi:hypothetical protein